MRQVPDRRRITMTATFHRTTPLTSLIRRTVPRSLRNALRRPRVTAARILAKIQFGCGRRARVELLPSLAVWCHPICLPLFEVFRQDASQRAELAAFRDHCTVGMRFLDVGAHWGAFSLVALRVGGPDARAVCVEASAPAVRVLRRNLELNQMASRAWVEECAAGSHDGQLQMLTTGAGGADYFVVPAEQRTDTVTVRQVALTNLCRLLEFAPTHVKIDVEGFEEEVFRGALGLLRAHRPKLFLELHGTLICQRCQDPRAVLGLLACAGYTRWFQEETAVDEEALEHQNFNARLFCPPE